VKKEFTGFYSLCLILIACLSLPSFAIAGSGNTVLSVGLGFEFATGEYGTGVTTDSLTIPLTIYWYPLQRMEFKLEVPYIYQSNSTTVSAGGIRFRRGKAGSGQGGKANGNDGTSADIRNDESRSQIDQSQSGLGNVSLKTGYVVLEEGKCQPRIMPKVYVEFPTADKNKGLGTGEFVTGLGLELDKWFGGLHAYLDGMYNFQGRSKEYDLKDFISYEGGVGYQVTDRLLSTLLMKGSTDLTDLSSGLLETRLKLAYRLTGRAGVEGYLATGLTSGSPDFGTGISMSYDF
jgi:hypothetical protein